YVLQVTASFRLSSASSPVARFKMIGNCFSRNTAGIEDVFALEQALVHMVLPECFKLNKDDVQHFVQRQRPYRAVTLLQGDLTQAFGGAIDEIVDGVIADFKIQLVRNSVPQTIYVFNGWDQRRWHQIHRGYELHFL